jgi:hypothetical protein
MKESMTCTTSICSVPDQAFLQTVKIRREVRDFLEAEANANACINLGDLEMEAENFLSRQPNGRSYGSLDFGLVLKLL